MKNKRWSVICCSIIFIAAVWFGIGKAEVRAEEETRTVRVGVYTGNGYHKVTEDGKHSGFEYEYLTDIAKFTGWKYEFVEGTWDECYERLEKGEIDLLGGVEKREDRAGKVDFAASPEINATNCLLIGRNSDKYCYEDFASFDGMRIGTVCSAYKSESLAAYAKENGFTYEEVRYHTEEQLQEALEKGEVDCAFLNDLRDMSEYEVIARFGYASLYYVTNPQQKEILQELDNALKKLHAANYYYERELYDKYFSSKGRVAFTREEKEYIEQNPTVKVVMAAGFPLICEYDEETGKFEGFIVDVLEEMSDLTGIQFEYEKIPTDDIPWDYLEKHPNQIMAPWLYNSLIPYGEQVKTLDIIEPGRMILVSNSGAAIKLDEEFTMAVPVDMLWADKKLTELFPKVNLIGCTSHQDGLNKVKKHEADVTLMNEILSTYYLQSPYYSKQQVIHTDNITEDITLLVADKSDPLLIAVMNKAISSLSERTIRQHLVDHTAARAYEMTEKEWLYQNRLVVLLTAALLVVGLIFIISAKKQEKQRAEDEQKRKLEEEHAKVDREYQEKMFYRANFDELTGLYNKNYFEDRVAELLKNHPGVVYSFFRINIEKFKMINEIFGQKRGDEVLCQIADLLREKVGERGVYARMYSDHFVLCYPVDERKLRKVRKETTLFLECDGQRIRVQLRIGVYINVHHNQNVAQLVDFAQIALQSKAKAREDTIYYYKDAFRDSLRMNQKITNEMEQALKEGQFQVFLQPQYELATNKLAGAEALIRWFHPVEGMISPGVFIPVFEENQFIYELDAYVCDQVCSLLAKWQKQGKMVPVSINLSRVDLQNPDLVPMLQAAVRKYQVPVDYLHLEITESAYAGNQEKLLRVMERLHQCGFVIEMDDFGSGYSSFHMLKDIPVDILKLDMQFFSKESNMDRGGNIIESVVSLARSLGILVIAEGVESRREANFLRSIQCAVVQGYLYAKPMDVPAFEALMKESQIGSKTLDSAAHVNSYNLYWNTEKYNLLLRNDNAIMFDYDPAEDEACYTMMQKDGSLAEQLIPHYSKELQNYRIIHPDYRDALASLSLKPGEVKERDFLADFENTGGYQWYHATVYCYYREDNFSRVLAVIRKNEQNRQAEE